MDVSECGCGPQVLQANPLIDKHPVPVVCVMCYVLCVMCYVLCVMCYVLCVMCYVICHMSYA
jgi:hypothetical protein